MTQGLGVRELKFSALSARLSDINEAAVPRYQNVIIILSWAAAREMYQILRGQFQITQLQRAHRVDVHGDDIRSKPFYISKQDAAEQSFPKPY